MPKDNEDKGKHKGQKKKDTDLWCTGDLVIDENGDLLIENTELGIVIETAWRAKVNAFNIYYLNPLSPLGKVNIQCPC